MFFRAIFFSILPLLVWIPLATATEGEPRGNGGGPYHIKADSLTFDDVTKTYRARGNAVVFRGEETLHADAVDFNDETKEATAWGDVHFFSGFDWVTGSRIDLNLKEGTGTVYDGTLFIEKNHFYFRGEKIHKTGKDSYFIKGPGSLTTCDGDSPDWEITGRDMKLTLEGYGTVKHAALRAKSIPVLYSPFVVFPAKIKRQTGLLIPMAAFSKTNGFEFHQPFFWAINDSADATFYEHHMARRGDRVGVEARYVRTRQSKVTAMYDYLWDKQIDDGKEEPLDHDGYWYEGYRGDSEPRLNRKRWWFRMKADWELPADVTAKLDVDVVSDQDYLREFDSGYSGYDKSSEYFENEFSRELADNEDTVRLSQLNLNKSWDSFSLNAAIQWNDDVIARKNNTEDTSLQRLPYVSFSGAKQELGKSSFYYDLSSTMTHFWRKEGTRGYALDVYPRVFYPTTLLSVLDFEPSVGFRETVWQVEEYEESSPNTQDELRSREIGDLSADLSTEISRVFDIESAEVDKVRHAIRPQVVYSYVPDVEQGNRPDFVDVIDEKNSLSYSVTNTLTSRIVEKKGRDDKGLEGMYDSGEEEEILGPEMVEEEDQGALALPRYAYHDFLRLSLSQTYDLLTARRPALDGNERQPFSDVSGRLEWIPFYDVELDFLGNVEWSPYTGDYTSYDFSTSYMNDRNDEFSLEYRYSKDSSENAYGRCLVHLFDTVAGLFEHEYNLKENEVVSSVLGLTYSPQCWTLALKYTHDRSINKREYFFEISLFGLGKYELGKYRPDKGTDSWMKKG